MYDLYDFLHRDRLAVSQPLQDEIKDPCIMEESVIVPYRIAGWPQCYTDLELSDKSDIFPAVFTCAESL